MMSDDPRQSVTDAVDRLISPIPGLEKMTGGRSTVFVGGGCLTWLVFGVFIAMYLTIKYGLIGTYVGVIFVARLSVVLAALIAWGWASEAGVIRRHKHPITPQ